VAAETFLEYFKPIWGLAEIYPLVEFMWPHGNFPGTHIKAQQAGFIQDYFSFHAKILARISEKMSV
jgi:hypothetical protein